MTLAKLDWCIEDNLNVDLTDYAGTKIGLLKDSHFDVIIGTDIVYWPTIIVPLVKTLVALFEINPTLQFYLCYIERHGNTHKSLLHELQLKGFKVVEIGLELTKPVNKYSFLYHIVR
jgi:hypothetical protein